MSGRLGQDTRRGRSLLDCRGEARAERQGPEGLQDPKGTRTLGIVDTMPALKQDWLLPLLLV